MTLAGITPNVYYPGGCWDDGPGTWWPGYPGSYPGPYPGSYPGPYPYPGTAPADEGRPGTRGVATTGTAVTDDGLTDDGVTDDGVTDADKSTLRHVRRIVSSARPELDAGEPGTADAARNRIRLALGYLTGFLDGKGAGSRAAGAGLAALVPAAGRPLADCLDDLDAALEVLSRPETRDWEVSVDIDGDAVIAVLEVIGLILLFL